MSPSTSDRASNALGRRWVWLQLLALGAGLACNISPVGPSGRGSDQPGAAPTAATSASAGSAPEPTAFERARAEMVRLQLAGRDITDPAVLAAMGRVPRERFVAPGDLDHAYADGPLPIGHGVTISQPYMVAKMTELARIRPGAKVLDVGTGSGYQAAVLLELGVELYGIEILEPLADRARATLTELGYRDFQIRAGDGWAGWAEHAPFSAIVVAAAPERVPPALLEQLELGGRLVLPVGPSGHQQLVVYERTAAGFEREVIFPVLFVPMTGQAQASGSSE